MRQRVYEMEKESVELLLHHREAQATMGKTPQGTGNKKAGKRANKGDAESSSNKG